nr:porin [Silvimonas soli]
MSKSGKFSKKAMLIAGASVFAGISSCAFADLDSAMKDLNIETSVYGFLNGQIESVQADGGATPYSSRGRISDGNSRLGFKGSIEINQYAKGIWQLEGGLNNFENGGVNDQGSSATLESRNSFVGVEDTRFGRVIVGNNDSIYRSLVGSGGEMGGNLGLTVHGLDLWNNTSAQMTGNANSLFSRGEARYKNSVHYLSPEFYGFQAGGSYGFDEAESSGGNRGRYSLAAKYTHGGFEIGVGYDRQGNTGVLTDKVSQGYGFQTGAVNNVDTYFYKVVASYKFPTKTYVGVGYEVGNYGYSQFNPASSSNLYSSTTTGSMKQSSAMISVAQDVREDTSIMLSYGKLGHLDNATFGTPDDYSATQFSVGALYQFNKYLATYVYYTDIKNKSQQNVNLGQSPIYSNNSGTTNAFLAPGDSPRAFGLGLIARF